MWSYLINTQCDLTGTVAKGSHKIDINPFIFTRGASRYARRHWNVIPSKSPHRDFKLERVTVKAEVKDYQWYATTDGKKAFQVSPSIYVIIYHFTLL
jgi:hypothetical protein